jgi:hypothetical protein
MLSVLPSVTLKAACEMEHEDEIMEGDVAKCKVWGEGGADGGHHLRMPWNTGLPVYLWWLFGFTHCCAASLVCVSQQNDCRGGPSHCWLLKVCILACLHLHLGASHPDQAFTPLSQL